MIWDESANPEVGKRILRGARKIVDGKTPIKIAEDRFEIPYQST